MVGVWQRRKASSLGNPPPLKKPASQTLDQGQRLLANTKHAGDWTALTRRAGGKSIIV